MIEEKDVRPHLREGSPWRILAYDVVGSTMEVAQHAAEGGCDDFLAIVADHQTCGSGRFDRPWYSPAESGLWMTVVLRPTIAPDQAPWFTLAAAVSVAEALSALGFSVGIKWPNDVLAANEACWRRKLCGIRAEMSLWEGGLDWVSVGIGLNVAEQEFPPEIAPIATSLEALGEGSVSREVAMAAILDRMEANYRLLEEGRVAEVREAWLSFALGLGEEVTVQDVDGERRGLAVGLADDGCLLVQESADAEPSPVVSGDLIFRV